MLLLLAWLLFFIAPVDNLSLKEFTSDVLNSKFVGDNDYMLFYDQCKSLMLENLMIVNNISGFNNAVKYTCNNKLSLKSYYSVKR